MTLKQSKMNDINWKAFNAINKRTNFGLYYGEIRQLTEEQIQSINEALNKMDELSAKIYTEFEVARNLFMRTSKKA